MEIASVVLVVGALVIGGVVQACSTGQIGPNMLAGIRLPSVMASPEAWRAGHQAAFVPTWITAAIAAVLGGIALFVTATPAQAGTLVLIGAGFLLVGAVWGAVVAHRAAVLVAAQPKRGRSR